MAAVNARWIVPVAVTAVVVGGGVAASAASDATPDLPEVSAEELLVRVHDAEPTPFSGTVRTVADLGLPDLGALAGGAGGPEAEAQGTDPASVLMRLASGENQLRVWVGGPEQQRVSLLDDFAELDVVRDGDEVWTYSSADDTATRYDLTAIAERAETALAQAQADLEQADPEKAAELARELEAAKAEAEAARAEAQDSPYADLTPTELARTLLADADQTTEVAVGDAQVVAGRDAYTLTATPRDDATLVGTVEVAVDAETGLVLQVEVGARDQADPAFVTGFTDLDLTAPDADVFAFSPPPGTTVVDALEAAEDAAAQAEQDADEPGTAPGATEGDRPDVAEPVVHGEGWSTAVELELPVEELTAAADQARTEAAETATTEESAAPTGDEGNPFAEGDAQDLNPTAMLEQLTTEVDGGRVFSTALLTVLLTDDGRLLVGPVDAATLQSYAG
ncbi:outer membrane lipoprotein carrier protein LolA [Jannaschia sp. R86511]|uniref:LolA family protein n=1 Tax=Jannaschia sp. R86511 TaxID=3093853 RepID=UPI0036D2699C